MGQSYAVRVEPRDGLRATSPLGNSFQKNDRPITSSEFNFPSQVQAADLDADDDPDLVVVNNASNTIAVLWNDRATNEFDVAETAVNPIIDDARTRTDERQATLPTAIAVGDLNQDGIADLAVANFGSDDISILSGSDGVGDAPIQFAHQQTLPLPRGSVQPLAIMAADMDGDDDLDLVVANKGTAAEMGDVLIFLNTGKVANAFLGFSDAHVVANVDRPSDLIAEDLDADGDLDLVVVSEGDNTALIFENELSATPTVDAPPPFRELTAVPVESKPTSVTAADLDSNGVMDVVVGNFSTGSVSLISLGTEAGDIALSGEVPHLPSGTSPTSLQAVDVDNDGDVDLAMSSVSTDTPGVTILRNDGQGQFQPAEFVGAGNFPDAVVLPLSIAAADLDGDGVVDFASANGVDDSVSILRNEIVQGVHRVILLTDQSEVRGLDFGMGESNEPPVANDDRLQTDEDVAIEVLPLLDNDDDADGNILTISLVDDANTQGQVVRQEDGTYAYRPPADYSGEDSFAYTVSDGKATSQPATVVVTIRPVNDAPVAVADAFEMTVDNLLLHVSADEGLMSNDSDPDHDRRALDVIEVSSTASGVLDLDRDGSFFYRPNPGFVGDDSFTYKVSDGELESQTVTVTIQVAGQIDPLPQAENDPPTASDDAFEVDENGELNENVLADNGAGPDQDADGDAIRVDTAPVTRPLNGQVELNADGTFRYTPAPDFVGVDRFSYRLLDDQDASDVGQVTITVVAAADEFTPQAGDANGDRSFDQFDIVLLLGANKYRTGQPASFAEGDFDGNGLFDQLDVIAALSTGNYLQGPYAAQGSIVGWAFGAWSSIRT